MLTWKWGVLKIHLTLSVKTTSSSASAWRGRKQGPVGRLTLGFLRGWRLKRFSTYTTIKYLNVILMRHFLRMSRKKQIYKIANISEFIPKGSFIQFFWWRVSLIFVPGNKYLRNSNYDNLNRARMEFEMMSMHPKYRESHDWSNSSQFFNVTSSLYIKKVAL